MFKMVIFYYLVAYYEYPKFKWFYCIALISFTFINHCGTLQEAIYKLNSLQSNKKVLEEASKRIMAGHGRSNNIETTKKYLKR